MFTAFRHFDDVTITFSLILQFLHSNLAVSLAQQDSIRDLEERLDDAMQEVSRLQKEVDRLKQLLNRGTLGYSKADK